jgi:GH15 family glucan-1,4-alpha-glucosidase
METQPPIADYALIGCTRSAALISRAGSIDWLAWPRFDAPSIFARLLDWSRGGHFSIAPAAASRVSRRYVDDTNVLETTFETDGGAVKLVDLMPVLSEEQKRTRLTPFRQLLRRVECLRGEVPVEVVYAPRPDYARVEPRFDRRGDSIVCEWGAHVLNLRSDVEWTMVGQAEACPHSGHMQPDSVGTGFSLSRFTLRAGESRTFALGFDDHTPSVLPRLDAAQIEETVAFWRQWASQLDYRGPYRDLVMRSALVLKLLAYAPSGGIVAAPTTSLPEAIGGLRNWDYRYCWLRDASFTVSALYDCGFPREGASFLDWLLYSTRLTQPKLQVLYDVFGESKIPERELPHLEGYRGSKPVRVGNDAADQFQLDVYGEVLSAIDEAVQRGEPVLRDIRRTIRRIADVVVKRWREPDSGIWEKRGGLHQHVHGKVMAWLALDCAESLGVEGLRAEKDAIHALVMSRGFDARRNTFVDVLDGSDVDASLLYIARVGFIDPADPRMLGTIDAIRARLGHGELIYRYDTRTGVDGLPPGEGAFLPCSFWLAEALALAGKRDEARDVFERTAAHANDVGLLSEEIDVATGELLGNFPQALTHIGLLNAALGLNAARRTNR